MKTTVVHCKKDIFDIYIGRPSKWGNPFRISKWGGRQKAVNEYKKWLLGETHKEYRQDQRHSILNDIEELRGKRLGCYCSPLACHGDVFIEILGGIGGKYGSDRETI